MSIDLKSITPDIDLSIFKKLLGDKTHFIYELVQNADDSKSTHLGLRLYENELFVWNDGRPFSQEDVQSICSTGSSDKDLTQIGSFGIGFKSVYNYTDFPEIYSSGVCFRIPYLKEPEAIDMDPRIAEIVDENTTVIFRLPFKDSLDPEDVTNLENHLCNLEKERFLLFLRYLKTIQWYDEKNKRTGFYLCDRPDKSQSPSRVELRASIDGENQLSETFLIFHKEVQPREDVVDRIQNQAEDCKEENRIQQSKEELQSIEVAFKLQDGKITTLSNCTLFAYLPTQIKTNLRFLIQARYQTTPSRENILQPSESPWNRWLVKETAKFIPEILEQLKSGGWLKPAFFNIIPLETDPVLKAFMPISEALQKAMQNSPLIPTEDGEYAKADSVFYPHRESLRGLVESSWLYPNSSWLHSDIRDTEEFRRCFQVMRAAGVREIGIGQILAWLEKQELSWFKDRCEEWLHSLYLYLDSQKSELERIKKLPLVRLESGEHVCASNELVFFPPNTDKEREKIEPFLSNLPILQATLLEGEERNEIEVFLRKSLEVKTLRPVNLILKGICPQYRRFPRPSVEKNRLHVRYLFEVWNDLSEFERNRLEGQISEIPILRAYKGIQCKIYDFVKPGDAYLPKAYTGDDNLETYFSVYNGDIWFVDHIYLEDDSEQKDWLQFLKAIGFMDTPRSIKKTIRAKSRYDQEFSKELNKRDIKWEYTTQWHNHWSKTSIEDFYLEGLSEILTEISEHKRINLSQVLWHLLVKVLISSEPKRRDAFFKGTYHWSYYGPQSEAFDAMFYCQLKEFAWLLDEQGKGQLPFKCFAPTSENRRVLGNSVAYLHPDFNIGTEPAKQLAKKLEICLKPEAENVLNYLQKLRNSTEVNVVKVEPLYRFLQREMKNEQLQDKFKKESLIFTPNPESCWWQVDEVFWEDKSGVLESARRCLKAHYPAMLKTFFINLGVSEQASQRDYACHIQEIATTEQAGNEKVRERVQQLYKCLHAWSDEWKIIYDNGCWLGKEGDEWRFFTRQELVLKDHPHISEIFEGEVPFWTFDNDLSSLASRLEVERCSQAKLKFYPAGEQQEDPYWSEKVRNLRLYIYAFLNSPRLYKELEGGKRAEVLDQLSVCQVQELKVTYKLKGISLPDPNPRQSFLDVTDQKVALWVGLEVDKSEYAELIGDALQDYFGAKELGRFVEDLLTPTKKQDRVLSNWKRKGLETKFLNENPKDDDKKQIESLDEKLPDEPNSRDADSAADESDIRIPTDNETPKTDSEGNESLTDKVDKSETHLSSSGDDDSTLDESESPTNLASDVINISSPETQFSTKADSGTTQNVDRGSESETPTVHEDPEIENENNYSTENESVASVYPSRSEGSGTRSRGGKRINTPSRNRGTGHSSGRSDGTEDNTHMKETGASPQARKEIEHAGMKHAQHYEKKEGRTPKDVSSENRGYDIYSISPDGKNRCIEVKARADRAFVLLTSNEWSIAKELKDDYFLYVVLNAATQPELYIIQNPADEISTVEQIDVRYQVPLSEITEHGKLV